MNRRIAVLTTVGVLAATAASAQTALEEAQGRARELTAAAYELRESARASANDARPAAAAASEDVPGVREEVGSLEVSVSRTCGADGPRYALYPISADLGPSFSAAGASLQSSYLYPREGGLSLSLGGDGPGATLTIAAADGTARALGTLAREDGPCFAYPDVSARVALAAGVSAALSVQPRTGIFSPACYKNITEGFYQLDTWTILTFSFPGETMTVRSKDGMSFHDEASCRGFYARLTAGS